MCLYRIVHLRLVLLRPNILAAARHALMSSVPDQPTSRTGIALWTEVSTICVQAAVSAITMLHRNLRSASRIFSSNAVFVTLSAATVIAAASLLPELDVSIDGDCGPYADVIVQALEVLEEHQWQVEGAPEAKSQLQNFLRTVNEARKRKNGGKLAPCLPIRYCSSAALRSISITAGPQRVSCICSRPAIQ